MSRSEKIYDQTFSARNLSSSPLTISSLNSDLYDYELIIYISGASGDSILDITFNSDTATNYRNYEMKGLSTTVSGGTGDSDTAIELQNIIGNANTNLAMIKILGMSGDARYIDCFYSADGAILKQASYWKNTADAITSMTLTANSSVTCDVNIILYRMPKKTNQGYWELIKKESVNQSAMNTTGYAISSSLDLDLHKGYKIVLTGANLTSGVLWARLNGDNGNNYTTQRLKNVSGTISSSINSAYSNIYPSAENDFTELGFVINGESGNKRSINGYISNDTSTGKQSEWACLWSNTADNVTSCHLYSNVSSTLTGTMSLYRRRNTYINGNALNFEIIKNITVSGDYSAGTTISGFTGNNCKLIKVEGLFSTIGNELRMQLASDTGANYSEQELKSNSTTTTASTVSGANYWVIADASSSKVASFELYIYPKDGANRTALLVSRTNENQLEHKALWWGDTTTDLDSLKIYTSSTTTTTGNIKVSILR